MVATAYRRALALVLLCGLFLWNAPAMAFPALVADLGHCEAPPKVAAPATAMPHHRHHAAMPMGMAMERVVGTAESAPLADCLSQHSCCTFNREPAQKNDRFALAVSEQPQPAAAARAGQSARPASDPVPHYRRAVFELKTDLRI